MPLLSKALNSGLGRKWGGHLLNWCLYGMPVLQLEAFPAALHEGIVGSVWDSGIHSTRTGVFGAPASCIGVPGLESWFCSDLASCPCAPGEAAGDGA